MAEYIKKGVKPQREQRLGNEKPPTQRQATQSSFQIGRELQDCWEAELRHKEGKEPN